MLFSGTSRSIVYNILFVLLFVYPALPVQSRNFTDDDVTKMVCRFVYPQGRSEIYSDMGDNAQVLNELDAFISSALHNPSKHIRRICLSGYSSIEGEYSMNERLAYERVEGFREYLRSHYPALYRYPVDVVWVPEDWEGLSALIKESDMNEREEILDIIRRVRSLDKREELLMKLNGGIPYRIMSRMILPELRRVEIEIEYTTSETDPLIYETDPLIYSVLEKDTINFRDNHDSIFDVENTQTQSVVSGKMQNEDMPFTFAIKTNIMSWIGVQSDFKYTTPLANVALEYYFTPSWSIELGAAYSYWRYDNNQKFQGISGYRLEPRFRLPYPNEKINVFMGMYGRVGDYDIRRPEKGAAENTNYTGDYWDVGLSAGFSFHLYDGWAVELGARAGYVNTNAILYTKEGDNNWFDGRKSYKKIKVTDLNVSLIYRFR